MATTTNPLAGILIWEKRRATEADLGFIVESWSRSAYDAYRDARMSVFRARLREYIDRCLARGEELTVAADAGDGWTLYGWIMRTSGHLVRFVFVKPQARRLGIARDLWGAGYPVFTSSRLTADALAINKHRPDTIVHWPFSEETNA